MHSGRFVHYCIVEVVLGIFEDSRNTLECIELTDSAVPLEGQRGPPLCTVLRFEHKIPLGQVVYVGHDLRN